MIQRQFVATTVEEHVFLITIDHPSTNALNRQTLVELESAVDEFQASPSWKVAILSGGEGPYFVSGADIAEFAGVTDVEMVKEHILRGKRLFQKITQSPKPVIAAINGLALGGGLELALSCHLRIIAERAKLGLPEINFGILPGWGGTQMLPRIVGTAKALEMILGGESISAREAFRLNLVNRVLPRPEVLPAARILAGKIAGKSSPAVRAALDSIRMSSQLPAGEGLEYETRRITELVTSPQAREGLQAFLEKRPPVFKDE